MSNYLKKITILLIVSTIMVGCSEKEKKNFEEKILYLLSTEEERIEMDLMKQQRKIVEEEATAETKKLIIDRLNSRDISYTSIDVKYTWVTDGTFINKTLTDKRGYKVNYKVTVENNDFLTNNAKTYEGAVMFYFNKDDLMYTTYITDIMETSRTSNFSEPAKKGAEFIINQFSEN